MKNRGTNRINGSDMPARRITWAQSLEVAHGTDAAGKANR